MCGIAGFLNGSTLTRESGRIIRGMADAIRHRGPDDSGIWLDEAAGVALGHRRLSVIDLSAAGHQPMESRSGRYVITYNGEIYNFRDLREELEAIGSAPDWRGHSDTEVLLAAIEKWGAPGALERLNGMFAFALWDRSDRVLTLARDRLGEKPLYYGRMADTFLFASELKALVCHPGFQRRVDRDALATFLRYNYIPAPQSIWCGILKLLPGHYLEVRDGGRAIGEAKPYWDFRAIAERGAADPLPDSPELLVELDALLSDAVRRRMDADVPLGAFLSGGIDSSLIVSLMQKQSHRPIRTFTIGFEERGFNEAVHAKAVAEHLGTDHTELYVTPRQALDVIPRLPAIWDEPFSDSSQVPTYLVSKLTREHVTVSLSGDGGDELFAGYNRYILGMQVWKSMSGMPWRARQLLASALAAPAIGRAAGSVAGLLPRYRTLNLPDRLPKVAQVIGAKTRQALYRRLVSNSGEGEGAVIGIAEREGLASDAPEAFGDFRQWMMYHDTLSYLPDDILAKVDRASMAVSLEGRIPFLDHRVVEFAWRLPMTAKIRKGKGKHALRQLLFGYVPETLVERPKTGFSVPIGAWLRGPLRDWAEDLLDERRVAQQGFFRPAPIRQLWDEHLSGRRSWHYDLWSVLMFQAWIQENEPQVSLGPEPETRTLSSALTRELAQARGHRGAAAR